MDDDTVLHDADLEWRLHERAHTWDRYFFLLRALRVFVTA